MLISVGELIIKSFDFAKEHWQKYLPYIGALLLSIVPYVLFIVLSMKVSSIFMLLAFISLLGMFYFSTLIGIAMVKNTKKLLDKQPMEGVAEGIKNAKPLFWQFLWVSILVGLIVGLGSIIVIPGIIFSVWYLFAQQEFIFNNQRGMDALNSSKKMVQGRWWAVLWRLIGPILPMYGVVAVLVIIMAIFSAFSQTLGLIIYGVGLVALVFAAIPYASCFSQLLYQDLKAKPVSPAVQK